MEFQIGIFNRKSVVGGGRFEVRQSYYNCLRMLTLKNAFSGYF